MTTIQSLISSALNIRKNSYAPYSKFKVGSALLTSTKKIYTGCNVENSSYSVCNCAERTAFFKAVSDGEKNFTHIAIVGSSSDDIDDYCPPCGVCRQVMSEFCKDDFQIILAKSIDDYKVYTLGEMLPNAFAQK